MARRFVARVALSLAAVVAVRVLLLGNVFPDEGWYLTAGMLVRQGRIPYRDFAFFQAPLSPYVYAIAGGDLWIGRLVSLVFGLSAWAITLALLRPRGALSLALAAAIVATNAYTWRWFTVSRNIAPAVFLTMSALALYAPGRRRLLAAGLLGALAAATRASAAAVLVAMAIDRLPRARTDLPPLLMGALVGLAIAVCPFAAADPSGFLFGNFLYHTGLYTSAAGPLAILWSKLHGLLRVLDKHLLIAVLALIAWLPGAGSRGCGRSRPDPDGSGWDRRRARAGVLTAILMTILHLIPGGFRPEYHELALLPLTLGLAPAAAARWPGAPMPARLLIIALSLFQLGGAGGQLASRVGWRPAMIAKVGEAAAAACRPGTPLVTFVPEIALAANRPLTEGFAMASCSLAFPGMGEDRARRLHMITLSALAERFESRRAGAVIWSGLGDADPRCVDLYSRADRLRVSRSLARNYRPVARVDRWTIWSALDGVETRDGVRVDCDRESRLLSGGTGYTTR